MRSSVTFTQALAVVGLFGLTFFTSTQAPLLALLALLGPPDRIDAPSPVALALFFAITLATLTAAALRSRTRANADDGLTFSRLLFLTGLLGLLNAALFASVLTTLHALLAFTRESDASITAPVVLQAVAFAIPLAVLAFAVAGMRRSRQSADPVTPVRLLMCMALLTAMFFVAAAPASVYSILWYAPDDSVASVTGSTLSLSVDLAVAFAPLLLVGWWSRTGAAIGPGRLIAIGALFALNALTGGGLSIITVLGPSGLIAIGALFALTALTGGGLSIITVVGVLVVLGLLWAGFAGSGAGDGVRTLNATHLLAGVGLIGLGVAGLVTPGVLPAVTPGLPAGLIVGFGALLAFFYAVPVAILVATGRRLRRAHTPA